MARIIIDLDETVYKLHPEWCNAHNVDFPDKPLYPEHILTYAIDKYAANGIKIYDYLERKELFTGGEAIEGSIDTTKQWLQNGYEVGIATRVFTPGAAIGKTEWLAANMPHIKAVFMLLNDSKWWIEGDIFIDDAPHHLAQVKGVRILYNQPHNQSNTDYVRASNWDEVNALVHLAVAAQNNGMNRDAIEELLKWVVSFGLLGEYVNERNSK